MKFLRALLLLSVLLAGCAGQRAPSPRVTVRFFLESGAHGTVAVRLPVSGVVVAVEPKPVLSEYDVVDLEIVHEEFGDCLSFLLDGAAARDLQRMSALHRGARLVLLVNGAPLGARRIDAEVTDGRWRTFVEIPEGELPALASRLRASLPHPVRKTPL